MREPRFVFVKGGRHRENRPTMLDGGHPARREAASIPDPVDLIDDRHLGVARKEEIGVQRMRTAALHGPARGHQGLPNHLATKYPLPPALRTAATEQIH